MVRKLHTISLIILSITLVGLLACNQGEREVVLETNYGEITLLLYDQTPIHRDNFVKLVKEGYYDSLLFHRVIPNFMIQGGDPNSRDAKPGQRLGGGGPGYTLEAEIGAPHFRGALAAARTGGASNPEKRSSGSQFYIVTGREVDDNLLDRIEQTKGIKYNETQREKYKEEGGYPMLDGDYTVFGEVIEGMDVVEEIAQQTVDQSDRPVKNVWMVARLKK